MAQVESFVVPGVEETTVTGLLGRLRLQKHNAALLLAKGPHHHPRLPSTSGVPTRVPTELGKFTTPNNYKKNWMEIERSHLQAYEYLCHVSEAKLWVESCIKADIGPLEYLGTSLQNGVHLARLAKKFQPKIVKRIFVGDKLQFRHSDNIHFFLEASLKSGLPKTFLFELTDLYSKKNIPKVIYCLHALSHLLSKQGLAPGIQDLVGYLDFTDDQLTTTKEELDLTGCNFPAFVNVGSDLNRAMEGTASIKMLGRSPQRSLRFRLLTEKKTSTLARHTQARSVRGKTITLIPSHVATLNISVRPSRTNISQFEFVSELSPEEKTKRLSSQDDKDLNSSFDNLERSSLRKLKSRSSIKEPFVFSPASSKSRHSSRHLQLSHVTYAAPTEEQMMTSPKLAMASYKELKKRPSCRNITAKAAGLSTLNSSSSRKKFSTQNMEMQASVQSSNISNRDLILKSMPSFEPPTRSTTNQYSSSKPSRVPGSTATRSSRASRIWKLLDQTDHDAPLPSKTPLSKSSPRSPDQPVLIADSSSETSSDASPLVAPEGHEVIVSQVPVPAEDLKLLRSCQTMVTEASPYEPEFIQDIEEPVTMGSPICIEKSDEYTDEGDEMAFEFEWENYEAFIIMAQSYVRGIQQRKRYRALNKKLTTVSPVVTGLQAVSRGYLARISTIDPIYKLRAAKEKVDLNAIRQLQAEARRVLARHRFIPRALEARAQAEGFFEHLYQIQALARRVLAQRKWTHCLKTLQDCRDVVITVQAKVRGYLVRQYYLEKFAQEGPYLMHNVAPTHNHYDKIIKFQEHYWAHHYTEPQLIPHPSSATSMGMNPPITAMKNFIHLLDDSGKDFSEEIQLAEGRQLAVKKIREIAQTEKVLNSLDIKIALLVRNRISLEEVLRLTRVVGSGASDQDRSSSKVIPLKNLDKENRQRLEGYQQLFYLLQTQPQYLARLLSLMNQPVYSGRVAGPNLGGPGAGPEPKRFFETVVLTLFGFANAPREEFMLLQLFKTAIHQELESVYRIEEFLRGNPVFIKLAVHYNRGAKERKYLRELLQPIIHTILDDPNVDLQTNPLLIYRALIKQEESRTGEHSQRPYDVTAEVAIQDTETRSVLISHLQRLRSITDQFIERIYSSLSHMPYGIRYIAKELKASLMRKFPAERESVIVRIVGHLVYYRYINPAIVAPESFGVIEMDISPHHRRCLAEVAKMLNQVSMGKLFSDDNVFLQPLNKYVQFMSEKFANYVNSVTEVDEPEAHFGTDALLDSTSMGRKPVIYISPSEIYSMHTLLADRRDLLTSSPEDPLAILLDELGPPPSVPSDQILAHSREISLHLVNRFPTINERDCELKQLFVEAKRLITYVIRVQSGTSLLDILEKSSGTAEEERFNGIVNKEMLSSPPTVSSVSDSNTSYDDGYSPGQLVTPKLVDITNMSYTQIKQLALDYARKLESGEWVSKEDGYQKLLNSIAADIRTKTKRRQQRADELSRIQQTLDNLNDKAAYLEDQRQTYADYLESCMMRQASAKKKSRPVPFTKQYFHMKELERRGEMPKFGSFRYTADKLHQKGVLVSINEFGPRQFDKINITISSDLPGQFYIVASYLGTPLPGGDAILTLEELLQYQFDTVRVISLFEGNARVNVNLLVYLINKKFYG